MKASSRCPQESNTQLQQSAQQVRPPASPTSAPLTSTHCEETSTTAATASRPQGSSGNQREHADCTLSEQPLDPCICSVHLARVSALMDARIGPLSPRPKSRVDDAHVCRRIVERGCVRPLRPHCVRKRLGLQLILVGNRQRERAHAGAVECAASSMAYNDRVRPAARERNFRSRCGPCKPTSSTR